MTFSQGRTISIFKKSRSAPKDEHIGKNIITLCTTNEIPVFSPLSIVLQTITTHANGNCEAETKVNIR